MLQKKMEWNAKRETRQFLSIGLLFIAVFSIFSFSFFRSSISSAATAPSIVTYQGKLMVNSLSVTSTQNMYFVLYDALTSGNVLYTAAGTISSTSSMSVTPSNGIFTVNLGGGSTNALDESIFQNNSSVYLEVRVGSEILTPRKQITASPFAFNSRFLDGVAATSTASSSTYIPISDSSGNFKFSNVTTTNATSTKFYSSGLSTFVGGIITNASSSIGAGLQVAGALSASGTLQVAGQSVLAGLATFTGGLVSSGNINASSSVFLSGVATSTVTTFAINPTATLLGGFISNASSSIGGQLTVNGALNASSTLIVTGATSLASTLGVTSLATFTNGFISNASSSFGGTVSISGATTVSSTFLTTGMSTFQGGFISSGSSTISSGGLNVQGNLSASSSATIGGNVSIKATSPSTYALEVNDNQLGIDTVKIKNTNASAYASVAYFDSSNNQVGGFGYGNSGVGGILTSRMYHYSNNSHDMVWSTDAGVTGAMIVKTSSNFVGIGTLTPVARFSVADAFTSDASGNISASGTAQVFGLSTLAGFISSASSSIGGALTVNGATLHTGNINASSSVFLSGVATSTVTTFAINPTATLVGGFIANASSSIGGQLTVNGALNASSTLIVTGATTLASTLGVTSLATFTGGFVSSASSSVGGDLSVTGVSRLVGAVNASSSFNIGGSTNNSVSSTYIANDTLYIGYNTTSYKTGLFWIDATTGNNGNISTSGTLKTFGLSTFSSGFISSASSSFGGNIMASGNINASSSVFLSGVATSTVTTFAINPTVTLVGGFIANASSSVGGQLTVNGALNASSTLIVTGATTLASTLGVTSLATFSGGFISSASSSVGGDLSVTGVSRLVGAVNASSSFNIGGSTNNSVSSTYIANDTLYIGYNTTSYKTGLFWIDATTGNNGNVSTSGTLKTFGLSTFTSGFIANASSTVAGDFQTAGSLNASSTLLSQGHTYLALGSSSNLGIGTTAPTYDIHLKKSKAGDLVFGVQNTNTTNNSILATVNDNAGSYNQFITFGSVATGDRKGVKAAGLNEFSSKGRLWFGTESNDDVFFGQNSLVRGILASSTFWGFGVTSTPARMLSVQGSGLISGDLTVANLTTTGTIQSTGSILAIGNLNTSSSVYLSGVATSTVADGFVMNGFVSNSASSTITSSTLNMSGFLKLTSTSTVATPLAIFDSGGNYIMRAASSTVEYMNQGVQGTQYGFASLIQLGNRDSKPAVLNFPKGQQAGGAVTFEYSTNIIGTQLDNQQLLLADGGSTTTTLSNNSFIFSKQATGNNGGLFIIDGNSQGAISASGTGDWYSEQRFRSGIISNASSSFGNAVNMSSNLNVLGIFTVGDGSTKGFATEITTATTTFTSYSSNAKGSAGFVFNTFNSFTSTTVGTPLDRVIFAVANGGSNKLLISGGGNVYGAKSFIANSSEYNIGDFAENVDVSEAVSAGDVVVPDEFGNHSFKKSSEANSSKVAGVITDTGAFVIGADGANRAPLAMAGIVNVKVSDENGPIAIGDHIVSGSMPGSGMRYNSADGKFASIIGLALEPLVSGQGKIRVLINKGGLVNGTIALSSDPKTLTVENNQGQLITTDLQLNGFSLLNVASIVGKNNLWEIDNKGYFVSHLATSAGEKNMYGLQSPTAEFVFSSSSQMMAGEARIVFDAETQEIIDKTQPLKVTVSLTSGEARGVYVSEKSATGFVVKELSGGISNATFDWIVVAKRTGQEVSAPVADVAGIKIESSTTTVETPTTTTTTVETTPTSTAEVAPAPAPEPATVAPVEPPPATPEPVVTTPAETPAVVAPVESTPTVETPAPEVTTP